MYSKFNKKFGICPLPPEAILGFLLGSPRAFLTENTSIIRYFTCTDIPQLLLNEPIVRITRLLEHPTSLQTNN